MHEYLKSGRQATRLLYFLIIGLAITKAVTVLFSNGGKFLTPTSDSIFLFIVFFSFIIRFFLGAYRVLSYDIELELRRPKVIIDIIAFFFQALAFYIFAMNYYDFTASQIMVITICLLDLFWLGLLAAWLRIMEKTNSQWIIHDIVIIVLVGINLLYWQSIALLVIISLAAFIVDFLFNYEFYFAVKASPGLKIFVSGPYHAESPEGIKRNVDKAKEVGKVIALKGHYPFIPHTMLHGWEADERLTDDDFKAIDYKWLEFCDALYFIASSPGADKEKEIATRKGLQLFTDLKKMPNVGRRKVPKF